MKAKKIIAIYLRLSSEDKDEDKDESNSITNQRFLLHSFIRKFPLDEYEVVEYVDDGYTGKNLDRPGMQRMLQDIRDRKVAIVVVKDFSRMARDHIIMGDFIDKIFPFLQIRFISVNDHFDSNDYADNGIIEEDVENQPNLIKLTMYADISLDMNMIKADLEKRLTEANIKVISIDTDILDESTWLNSWQQYIEPTEILPNLIIKPAWQEYNNVDNKIIIEIDSDISFGTGSHETTRTCAELLKSYSKSMDLDTVTCLDIGTGTGILLLVAAHLGIKNLVGIDIEEYAANQARINCENNHVSAEIICGNLDSDFNGTAQLILANLTVDPLKILLPQIGKKLDDKGILIISGIIDDRYDEIMPYIEAHWHIIEERVAGPWHTFALEKR